MRQLLYSFLRKLLVSLAWLVVLGALTLYVLEEGGYVTSWARTQLAARLGRLADGLTLERVRLHWFEPGFTLEGLSLQGKRADASGAVRKQELLRIHSLHVSLAPDLRPTTLVRAVTIDGGRVQVSDDLLEVVDEAVRAWRAQGAPEAQVAFTPPFVGVTRFAVDVLLPDGTQRELGSLDLVARPGAGSELKLHGRIVPSLAGAVPDPEVIVIDGERWETGFRVRATARDVRLQSRSLVAPAILGALPGAEFEGELSLDARLDMDFARGVEATGNLRAAVHRATLVPHESAPPIEDLSLDVETDFDLARGGHLWDRDTWAAKGRLRADWNGSPVNGWVTYGRSTAAGTILHAWARAEHLSLNAETYRSFLPHPTYLAPFEILGFGGRAELAVDLRIPDAPEADRLAHWSEPVIAARVRHTGESTFTFHGWPGPYGREGFPLPCEEMRGDWLLSYDPGASETWRVGIVDTVAEHGTGSIRADGWISAPDPADPLHLVRLDLEIEIPEMEVGPGLELALSGHHATRTIFRDYGLRHGTLSSRWRLARGPEYRGLTAEGSVVARDSGMAWRELPVPLEGLFGRLDFRWDVEPIPVLGEEGRFLRACGFTYHFENDAEATGLHGSVTGVAREELPHRRAIALEEVPFHWVQEVEVELGDVLLRGRDWDVFAAQQPEVGEIVTELAAKGSVHALYRGGRATPSAPFFASIEATPRVVEVTPTFFRRRTRNLVGRILARTEEPPGATEPDATIRLSLSGEWPDGVELAAVGYVPPRGEAAVDVYGAGIDPSNTAFQGALLSALTEDEPKAREGFDSAEQGVSGRIDFHTRTWWDVEEEEEAQASHLVFLRENDLYVEGLRLDSMRGVLRQEGDYLLSDHVRARIATHEIDLRDVLILTLADAAKTPDADPLLLRKGFWNDPDGIALQAVVDFQDLPADREHLAAFLEPETVQFVCDDLGASGFLDLHGARMVVISEGPSSTVAVRGQLVPHHLSLDVGLPVFIYSANVELEEFVLEGERLRGWCSIEGMDATIMERELDDASMIVSYVDGRLTIDDLAGAFEGGRLSSLGGELQGGTALAVDVAEPYGFDLRILLDDVNVAEFLQGVFTSSVLDEGLLDMELRLKGKPGRLLDITGSGWANLDEGALWSIPVMRELFGQIGLDKTAIFDRMRSRFEVHDGRIHVSSAQIRSNLVHLIGSGHLDFDGSLAFDFELRYGLIDWLGPFNKLLYWLNNNLWRVAVRGDMTRPRVTIRNSLIEFFSGFDDEPDRELPLPSFATPSPLF